MSLGLAIEEQPHDGVGADLGLLVGHMPGLGHAAIRAPHRPGASCAMERAPSARLGGLYVEVIWPAAA
jgi:hypothetical protein